MDAIRIAIDARPRRPAGALDGAYGDTLLGYLATAAPEHAYDFYSTPTLHARLRGEDRLLPLDSAQDVLASLRRRPPALYHLLSPGSHLQDYLPLRLAPASLLSVPEHPPIATGDLEAALADQRRRTLLRHAASWVTRLVVPTERARRALARETATDPERIAVVPPGIAGVPAAPPSQALLDWFRAKYGLPPRFLLGMANGADSQPLARIEEAFRSLRPGHPELLLLELASAGQPGVAPGPAHLGRARVLVDLPEDERGLLFHAAELVVDATPGEHFPLAALEVLAAGTVLVAPASETNREVLGEAALPYEAGSVASLAGVLAEVLASPERRRELRRLGREPAERHSHERCARCFARLHAEALEAPPTSRAALHPELVQVFPVDVAELPEWLVELAQGSEPARPGKPPARLLVTAESAPPPRRWGVAVDLDELALWHEVQALGRLLSRPDRPTYLIDLGLAGDRDARPALNELVRPLTHIQVGRGDGAPVAARRALAEQLEPWVPRLPLPARVEELVGDPRGCDYVSHRLVGRALPGEAAGLRSVWLGRPGGRFGVAWEAPAPELAARALAEAGAPDPETLALLVPETGVVSPAWLARLEAALEPREGAQRFVLPLPGPVAAQAPDALRALSRRGLAGVVLDLDSSTKAAVRTLSPMGLPVYLRVDLGASGADVNEIATQAAQARELEVRGVVSRYTVAARTSYETEFASCAGPEAIGGFSLGELLVEAVEATRPRAGSREPSLALELLLVRLELRRAQAALARDESPALADSMDAHARCRRERQLAVAEHQHRIDALEAYIARLHQTLTSLLATPERS